MTGKRVEGEKGWSDASEEEGMVMVECIRKNLLQRSASGSM
jgi:hypothetical protein